MFLFVTFLFFMASTCSARPNFGEVPKNMITAPTNCPIGQQWVNGQCREVWSVTAAPFGFRNFITVPTNCPEGQEFINEKCREVWNERNGGSPPDNEFEFRNVVTVPTNCKPGQEWVNGSCRDVWRSGTDSKNVIQVPPNCPPGQELINGQCREIWRSQNQIRNYNNNFGTRRRLLDIPDLKCPKGYKRDGLGICRKIFKF